MIIPLHMLPDLFAARGLVHILTPLPVGAALTPGVALAYAQALIEAAAKAEGDKLISNADTAAFPSPQ